LVQCFFINRIDKDVAITFEDAQEYLSGQNIELPDMILRAIVAKVNKLDACFMTDPAYSDEDIILLSAYLVALLSVMSADARIRSQTAPSGAAQSFQLSDISERYKSYTGLINTMDPKGCTAGIIPPNPAGGNCALFISPGACGCE
jgi:hypothetical protein